MDITPKKLKETIDRANTWMLIEEIHSFYYEEIHSFYYKEIHSGLFLVVT